MRHRKNSSFSGSSRRGRVLLWGMLAALLLLTAALLPGCMAQQMVWSARGTMVFLPAGAVF